MIDARRFHIGSLFSSLSNRLPSFRHHHLVAFPFVPDDFPTFLLFNLWPKDLRVTRRQELIRRSEDEEDGVALDPADLTRAGQQKNRSDRTVR